jgi:hypothetical protein
MRHTKFTRSPTYRRLRADERSVLGGYSPAPKPSRSRLGSIDRSFSLDLAWKHRRFNSFDLYRSCHACRNQILITTQLPITRVFLAHEYSALFDSILRMNTGRNETVVLPNSRGLACSPGRYHERSNLSRPRKRLVPQLGFRLPSKVRPRQLLNDFFGGAV